MVPLEEAEAKVRQIYSDRTLTEVTDLEVRAKFAAVDAVLAAVPARDPVRELRHYYPPPHGLLVEHCLDPRVTRSRRSLGHKHLRRGELVYLEMHFSGYTPWWRVKWHTYRNHGNAIRHAEHEFLDHAFLSTHSEAAAVMERLQHAAGEQGWELLPPEVDVVLFHPTGWNEAVSLSHLLFCAPYFPELQPKT